jgi:hypothetical protein
LGWSAGEGGDHVEVAVVVEDGDAILLGRGGDEEVGERQGPMEACMEGVPLDLQGAGEAVVVGAQVVEGVQPGADARRFRAVCWRRLGDAVAVVADGGVDGFRPVAGSVGGVGPVDCRSRMTR